MIILNGTFLKTSLLYSIKMSKETSKVSVLIRTRDIERHFPKLLFELSHQTLKPSELVIVNNFSSKEKLEEMIKLLSTVKKKFFNNNIVIKIVPVTDKEFSHAYSTNVGVFVAENELVCITNGHSLPASPMWIENGVRHFKKFTVAGVGGYFAPHKDGTLWEKISYDLLWGKLNEISRAYIRDKHFSTINCVLRKSLWKEYPFDEKLPKKISHAEKFGGEDYDWAMEMLSRGYEIHVEPKFKVYHSHGEQLPQLISKHRIWNYIKKKIKTFKRPRKSYTRLLNNKPLFYNI